MPSAGDPDPFVPPGPIDRDLLPEEAAVLRWLVDAQPAPVRAALETQLPHVHPTWGRTTELDLAVGAGDAVCVPDGPLPGAALVLGEADEAIGIIALWLTAGFISGLEYSWFDGPMPRSYPDVARLRPMSAGA